MRSTQRKNFAAIAEPNVPRSMFNLSKTRKQTFDVDYLYPFYLQEIIPGDTMNVGAAIYSRMNTPAVPIMDNLYLDTFFFFVPNRLVWDNWKAFWGEQVDPNSTISFTVPTIDMAVAPAADFFAPNQLGDYLGLVPQGVAVDNGIAAPTTLTGVSVCAFPSRGYNLIWNNFFRDENLQNSVTVDTGDSADDPADYTLLKRGKRKDYFTSCLPAPQKFVSPGVTLPLGGTAPLIFDYTGSASGFTLIRDMQTGAVINQTGTISNTAATNFTFDTAPVGPTQAAYDPNGTLEADLSAATSITVNAFREAIALQQYLELNMRGGTRYNELVMSEYGVFIPDATLQRPELLMMSSAPIKITPVAQTSESTSGNPVGLLGAFGTAFSQKGFSKSFTEHGYIIGILMVRADLTYQQGNDRHWYRQSRYDYHHPLFEGIGEQAVLNQEIYVVGTTPATGPVDTDVFGWQERYAEYKYGKNEICAVMRSSATASLDLWHAAQEFANTPALDETFIEEAMPIDRLITVTAEPAFTMDSAIQVKAARMIKVHGTPGLRRL